MNSGNISLELMNPRGEIEKPPVYDPSPRVSDLSGKKIGLYSNGKHGVDHLYTVIENLLQERYPGLATKRLVGPFEIKDTETDGFVSDIDAFIYAVGD